MQERLPVTSYPIPLDELQGSVYDDVARKLATETPQLRVAGVVWAPEIEELHVILHIGDRYGFASPN